MMKFAKRVSLTLVIIAFFAFSPAIAESGANCGSFWCWQREDEQGGQIESHSGDPDPAVTGSGWNLVHTHLSSGGYAGWHARMLPGFMEQGDVFTIHVNC